jgi:hypothetical protein
MTRILSHPLWFPFALTAAAMAGSAFLIWAVTFFLTSSIADVRWGTLIEWWGGFCGEDGAPRRGDCGCGRCRFRGAGLGIALFIPALTEMLHKALSWASKMRQWQFPESRFLLPRFARASE